MSHAYIDVMLRPGEEAGLKFDFPCLRIHSHDQWVKLFVEYEHLPALATSLEAAAAEVRKLLPAPYGGLIFPDLAVPDCYLCCGHIVLTDRVTGQRWCLYHAAKYELRRREQVNA